MTHYISRFLGPFCRISSSFFLLGLASTAVDAQVREVIFSSFPADSMLQVRMETTDSVEVRTWNNSAIFVETQVDMTGCSENLLKAAVEKGRYRMDASRSAQGILLRQADSKRVTLNSPKGACGETVIHKVYLPVGFRSAGDRLWSRPEDTNKTTLNY